MGFPVINVERVGDGNALNIMQEKFCADSTTSSISDASLWNIPIEILTSDGKVQNLMLDEKSMTINLDNLQHNGWYKVNPEFVGFYRVAYRDPSNLDSLMSGIASQTLSEIDRLGLLDDMFALVHAGKASTVDALKLIKAFKAKEESYVCWSAIVNCLGKLKTILADSKVYESHFMPFVVDLMSNIASKIGWEKVEGEHHTKTLLRSQTFSVIGCNGHEPTITEAKRRFEEHVSGKAVLPADIRGAVYRIVAQNGDDKTHDQLVKLYLEEDLHEEKSRLLSAMGSSKDVNVLQKVLDFSISEAVRHQDITHGLGSVANNVKGRDLAWNFVKGNYTLLHDRYKHGSLMRSVCQQSTRRFVTEEMAQEIEHFFQTNPNPAERAIRQSIENIRLNASWIERDGQSIEQYLCK